MTKLINKPVIRIDDHILSVLPDSFSAPYDNKARLYEFLVGTVLYNRIFWGTTPGDYTAFAEQAIRQSDGTLLDVGCGGLVQTAPLYARSQRPLWLLDNSVAMLRTGRRRLTEQTESGNNIQFIQADAFHLPFDDGAFDTVVSFGMIHLFDNKQAFVAEALRVLKPGGDFHCSSLTTDRPFSAKYLAALHKRGEVGTPLSAAEILTLFPAGLHSISHRRTGSMVFINGRK